MCFTPHTPFLFYLYWMIFRIIERNLDSTHPKYKEKYSTTLVQICAVASNKKISEKKLMMMGRCQVLAQITWTFLHYLYLLISQQQWLQSGLTWKWTHCSVVCLSFLYHVVNKSEVIIEMCWRKQLFNVFSSPSESENQRVRVNRLYKNTHFIST